MQKLRILFIILGLTLSLSACGELGTVLSSQGSYRVNAMVDNEYTLDEYSVINHNSKIRPFFVNSVSNDPDVRGLTVFVQDYSGAIVSRKVHYRITGEEKLPAASQATEKQGSKEPPSQLPAEKTAGNGSEDSVDRSVGDENSRTDGDRESSPDSITQNTPEDESPLTEGTEKPEQIATGVTEPDTGGTETGGTDIGKTDADETDTGKTDSRETETDGANTTNTDAPVEPIPEDQVLQVKQLDQYLPTFRIFENLEIGRYNLVFQVLGEKEILYKTSKPIYFLADAEFTLGEIQSYLPGIPTGGKLIPPGINVVLETEISSDERLDPFVIWYSGKKIMAQGRKSDGANYFLWKTPEQTGFHSVRAEVFPLRPEDRGPENIIGRVKELSLPISSKSAGIKYFVNSSDEFISWYQFWGNLDDAKSSHNPEKQLVPLLTQKPRWIPFAGMYGLFIGPDDAYALPEKPFSVAEEEQGTGRIFIHLAALSEGTILSVSFNSTDEFSGTAVLDLSLAKENLTLRLSLKDESLEESLALNPEERDTFITLILDFDITPEYLGASLTLENPARKTEPLTLALAKPISGDGTIRFGGTGNSAGYKRNAKWPVFDRNGIPQKGTAILKELAFAYTRVPIVKNDDVPEPDGNPALTSLPAEIPSAEYVQQQEQLGKVSLPLL